MKIILNYDITTGQITDSYGSLITSWIGLNYETVSDPQISEKETISGDTLIRIMKISAHVSDPDKVKDL